MDIRQCDADAQTAAFWNRLGKAGREKWLVELDANYQREPVRLPNLSHLDWDNLWKDERWIITRIFFEDLLKWNITERY